MVAENALYSAITFIYDALDNCKKSMTIFLDLAKAFNTVDYSKLIEILLNFGLKNSNLSWFKMYLEKKIIINGTSSEEIIIICGVPQSNILDPVLFILYINSTVNSRLTLRLDS